MRRLRYTDAARDDIAGIARSISMLADDLQVGLSVAGAIVAQCEKLASLPGTLGRPRPELSSDLRSFPFRDYMIFFYYTDDALEVVNVLSARRDIDAHFDQGRK